MHGLLKIEHKVFKFFFLHERSFVLVLNIPKVVGNIQPDCLHSVCPIM